MSDLFLGFDLSTQQIKVVAVNDELNAEVQCHVEFDVDTPEYKTRKGVYTNPSLNEVYAPVAMWIKAFDILLEKLRKAGLDFSRVKSISGAGQQHGSVYWSEDAAFTLANLDHTKPLETQICPNAFSHQFSPNWQDHSTVSQCEALEEAIGGPDAIANITGSKTHHRFTGPQIMRVRERHPDEYYNTARISLVSSFFASLLLGKIAPLDVSDVCGMNLWDITKETFDEKIINIVAGGGSESRDDLLQKLGSVEADGSKNLGFISDYYVKRYGFASDCIITPITGDNPATILALPLRPNDVIVSLGTSTTLLVSTPIYKTSPQYHLFSHPTTRGLYMGMLCYCNGSLAREKVRDEINSKENDNFDDVWDNFNKAVISSTPLNITSEKKNKIGIYFPLPEIVPDAPKGTWRFLAKNEDIELITNGHEVDSTWNVPADDARAILESQNLSMRLRAGPLLSSNGKPRRVYVVGGGSKNSAICQVTGEVLGPSEGVYALELGSNACALGAAYKALWALKRKQKGDEYESFEDFLESRWDENVMLKKVDVGYRSGIWEKYGEALHAFEKVEEVIVS
ncbi:hypothetical protein V1514DRAFT_219671 [Lipomyces japonicus]|uniref:uncharacterized protein n=1 Tax=Lipomyces japonicus TaxID=56871 RepID=UPI0034CE68E2